MAHEMICYLPMDRPVATRRFTPATGKRGSRAGALHLDKGKTKGDDEAPLTHTDNMARVLATLLCSAGLTVAGTLHASTELGDSYVLAKVQRLGQNSAAAPTIAGTAKPYRFQAFVEAASPISLSSATLSATFPGSPQALTGANDGTGAFSFQAKFATAAALDAAYPDGSFRR